VANANPKINGQIAKYCGSIWEQNGAYYILAKVNFDLYNFVFLHSAPEFKRQAFNANEKLDAYIKQRRMKYLGRIEELDLQSFEEENKHAD
jgi:hypothetical protein